MLPRLFLRVPVMQCWKHALIWDRNRSQIGLPSLYPNQTNDSRGATAEPRPVPLFYSLPWTHSLSPGFTKHHKSGTVNRLTFGTSNPHPQSVRFAFAPVHLPMRWLILQPRRHMASVESHLGRVTRLPFTIRRHSRGKETSMQKYTNALKKVTFERFSVIFLWDMSTQRSLG